MRQESSERQQKLREELQRQTDVPNELQELTEKQYADKTSHPSPQVNKIQYAATNEDGTLIHRIFIM